MSDQEKGISTQAVMTGLFGLAIGALLVYLLLKNQSKSLSQNMALQNQQPTNIDSLGLSINTLKQKIYDIEKQLKGSAQPNYQPSESNVLPVQMLPAQENISSPILATATSSPSSYKNKEIVEYIKDVDGDIIRKITTRDASINDQRK